MQQDTQLAKDFLNLHRDEDPNFETDNWKILITEDEINQMNGYLASVINTTLKGKKVVVTVALKGAAYLYVDLTRRLTIPHTSYFIEASSYKDAQTQQEEVELLSKIVPSKFESRTVLLIDELFDNGATLHRIKNKILQQVPSLKESDFFTCTIFKKDKETSYPAPDLVGFTIPNVWVVGYGLDDAQEKRSWPHLFAKPKAVGVTKSDDDRLFEDWSVYLRTRHKIQAQLMGK